MNTVIAYATVLTHYRLSFNDDTSLCFGFSVGYHDLLSIGDESI